MTSVYTARGDSSLSYNLTESQASSLGRDTYVWRRCIVAVQPPYRYSPQIRLPFAHEERSQLEGSCTLRRSACIWEVAEVGEARRATEHEVHMPLLLMNHFHRKCPSVSDGQGVQLQDPFLVSLFYSNGHITTSCRG